jgi:hypothetical protein
LHHCEIISRTKWLGVRIVWERTCWVWGHVRCPSFSHLWMNGRS